MAATPVNVYTDEKAQRLMRTFTSSLAFSLLIGWFEIMILRPASDMRRDMEHMDPSEIITKPFPLTNVTIFSMLPLFTLMIVWTVSNPSTIGWKILSFVKVTGLIFVTFGLCGNDLIATWQHSIPASLYLATLLCTNLTEKRTPKLTEELPFFDHSDLLATTRLYMTIAFVIPFSILSVLDHGNQQQRWPVPVLMGGTYGFAFGSIAGLIVNNSEAKKIKEKK
eukprot:CAMPEP_0168189210 /NCGR_PEP_ID=MMETSP0139_2-20121125/16218_1 /TAXON_ID=44445 /ORGANISM="Pseudo-nitzschia australis, Strain 10249 10 AB" /LENGTH=222 /DNA_ID=CAMNT_0008112017 /DNA_START=153 /DNA_END=821 /DNA_ORIENTATION=-